MAALPVYISAWSALLSAAMDEKPLAKPPASTSCWILVSDSVTAGSDHAFGLLAAILAKTSGPPMRSTRYSSHIRSGHLDWPPSENGAMPASLNFGTSAISSSHVLGGSAPTLANTSLLKYSTTG